MGVVNVKGCTIVRTSSDTGKMYSFRLEKKDYKKTRLHIAASSAENADRWIDALSGAAKCPVSTPRAVYRRRPVFTSVVRVAFNDIVTHSCGFQYFGVFAFSVVAMAGRGQSANRGHHGPAIGLPGFPLHVGTPLWKIVEKILLRSHRRPAVLFRGQRHPVRQR